jgi:hypothetical protein
MPRIRTLKPEHRTHRKTGALSDTAYRLWVGMIMEADDDGRLVADAEQLRVLIFGYQPDTRRALVEASLQEIVTAGLVLLYEVEGVRYAWFPSWHDHQKIDRKTPSKLPPYTPHSADSSRAHRGLVEGSIPIKDQGSRKGSRSTTSSSAPKAPEEVKVSTPEQHAKEGLRWGTPEALVDLYHELIPAGHPRVTLPLSVGRLAKAKAYLKQWPDRDFWVKAFGMVGLVKFMREGSADRPNFRADFDWFLQKGLDRTENCLKAFEEKYRRDQKPAGSGTEPPLTWGCAACGKSHSTGRELKGVCQKAEEEAAAAALRATRSNIIPITDHRKESA